MWQEVTSLSTDMLQEKVQPELKPEQSAFSVHAPKLQGALHAVMGRGR